MGGSDSGAKPAQTGLVDMGDIGFYGDSSTPVFNISELAGYQDSFSEIVLNVTWAELQPAENGQLDTSAIESAIAEVDAFNAQYGTDIGIKLRVWGGFSAPEWAKTIDGPAITVTGMHTVNPMDDSSQTIGRFWTADYIDAWTNLQNELASIYDSNPVIRGISNTAGAAATDEPFVPLQPDQMAELESGGYRDAAEELTLRAAIADYSGWLTTPLDDTMNLFHLEDGGTVSGDENFTLAVLEEAENARRLVQAGNHALNNPLYQPDAFVYAQLAEDAALDPATVPGSYQTASPVKLAANAGQGSAPSWGAYADWPNVVSQGVAAYAGDIELWDLVQNGVPTGFTGLSSSQVQSLAATLAAGTPPTSGAPDDGAALGFIAPASVSGAPGAIALTGVDAVLLASAASAGTYTITLTSTHGDTLGISDFYGIVDGPTSGGTLTFTGSLAEVNTVLASLTDTVPAGTDIIRVKATDRAGDTSFRRVGVTATGLASSAAPAAPPAANEAASADPATFIWTGAGSDALFSNQADWTPADGPPGASDTALFTAAASPNPAIIAGTGQAAELITDDTLALAANSAITVGQNGAGDLEIADQPGTQGTLILGGVESALTVAGNFEIGDGGLLLASLAPAAYSTASLAIGGTLALAGEGAARVAGTISAGAVSIGSGGIFAAAGTLTATGPGPIVNDGTIEAAADQTLGLQELMLASPVGGTGTLLIDPGATLTLADAVGPYQSITFAPPSIAQLADDPYSPSTLVLETPFGMQGTIGGFSFAASLVLDGVTASGASYDATDEALSVASSEGALNFSLSGSLSGLEPSVSTSGSGADAESTITFVAPASGAAPGVTAPATLEGAAGAPVLVPDIVAAMPLPATLPADTNITVTVSDLTGALAVSPLALSAASSLSALTEAEDDGTLSIVPSSDDKTLTLSGTLAAVETGLQNLTYTAASGDPTDGITITASDYAGVSAPAVISVFNNSAPLVFDWAALAGGSFSNPADWTASSAAGTTPPGGTNIAAFGAGTYSVSGDGAVGGIEVAGTPTFTGRITAQGRDGVAVTVDSGGTLTLASGAVLTAWQQAVVGDAGAGMLTLAGGALALTGAGAAGDLVIGENEGSTGTVFDLEQIEAAGIVTVGECGSGALHLLGVASSLWDSGAEIGALAGAGGTATVDGGEWTNNGTLTVGGAGIGALLIDGTANGVSGQVTAYDAAIGAAAGGQGTLTMDGGDLLVANADAATSTLGVGVGGAGMLAIENGGVVTVGEAQGNDGDDTGVFVVGGGGLVHISGDSALQVDGNALIDGGVTVGSTKDESALFAMAGVLAIEGAGSITLSGSRGAVRASTVSIAPGGVLSGAGTLSGDGGGNGTVMLAAITNDGSIAAAGGNLLVYGGVAGAGQLSVGGGATMTLQAAISSGQTLAFSPNAEAVLDDPQAFAGTITGFSTGDQLDLASTHAWKACWSAGVLTLETSAGPLALDVAGNYAPDSFSVTPDGLGGTLVGTGEGDVHLTAFSGLHYNFQAVGEFVAARSTEPGNPFQVQIETVAANGAVSITTALAAALAGARVEFAAGRAAPVSVNGVPDMILRPGAMQGLAGGTLTQLSSDAYRLTWSAGESITVVLQGGYLDWQISLGPNDALGSIEGLLGGNDSEASGSVPSESALVAAWSVSPGTSLFDTVPTESAASGDSATTGAATQPLPYDAASATPPSMSTRGAEASASAGLLFISTAGASALSSPECVLPAAAQGTSDSPETETFQELLAQSPGELLGSFTLYHLFGTMEPRVTPAVFDDVHTGQEATLHWSTKTLGVAAGFTDDRFAGGFHTGATTGQ